MILSVDGKKDGARSSPGSNQNSDRSFMCRHFRGGFLEYHTQTDYTLWNGRTTTYGTADR
jgi:hypothetical protein